MFITQQSPVVCLSTTLIFGSINLVIDSNIEICTFKLEVIKISEEILRAGISVCSTLHEC